MEVISNDHQNISSSNFTYLHYLTHQSLLYLLAISAMTWRNLTSSSSKAEILFKVTESTGAEANLHIEND